jgi:hypothetical protein
MAKLTENLNLQRGLLRRLKELPDVHILDKTRVQSIRRDTGEGGWSVVHLENGQALRARLLVSEHAQLFCSPGRDYRIGWCRRIQFSGSHVCSNSFVRLVVRHSRDCCDDDPSTAGGIRKTEHCSFSAFLAHRPHCLLTSLSHCFLAGLVHTTSPGFCFTRI